MSERVRRERRGAPHPANADGESVAVRGARDDTGTARARPGGRSRHDRGQGAQATGRRALPDRRGARRRPAASSAESPGAGAARQPRLSRAQARRAPPRRGRRGGPGRRRPPRSHRRSAGGRRGASAAERDRALEDLRRAEITNDLLRLPDLRSANPRATACRRRICSRGRGDDRGPLRRRVPRFRRTCSFCSRAGTTRVCRLPALAAGADRAYELAAGLPTRGLRAVAACHMSLVARDRRAIPSARRRFSPRPRRARAQDPAAAAAEARPVPARRGDIASWGGQFERAIAAAEESLRYEASRPGPSGRGVEALDTLWARPGQLGRSRRDPTAASASSSSSLRPGAANPQPVRRTVRHQLDGRARNAGQVLRAARRWTRGRHRAGLDPSRCSSYKLSSRASLSLRRPARRGDRRDRRGDPQRCGRRWVPGPFRILLRRRPRPRRGAEHATTPRACAHRDAALVRRNPVPRRPRLAGSRSQCARPRLERGGRDGGAALALAATAPTRPPDVARNRLVICCRRC